MATRPGESTQNVAIEFNAQGLAATLTSLQNNINTIIGRLNEAARIGQQAVDKAGQAGAAAAANVAKEVRALSQLQGAQRTIAMQPFSDRSLSLQIGKVAEQYARLNHQMRDGATAADRLKGRMTGLVGIAGELQRNQRPLPRNHWDKYFQIENALNAHKQIERSYAGMVARINQLSPEGQRRLSPLVQQMEGLRNRFTSASARGTNSLDSILNEQKRVTEEISKQIALTRQQDTSYQQLLRTTQRRTDALLAQNAAQREAQLRADAGRYTALMDGRGPGRFNSSLGGTGLARLNGTGHEQLIRSTATVTAMTERLNRARESGKPKEVLDEYIRRLEHAQQLQAQALAQRERENRASTFAGGFRQGVGGVLAGMGGGGGPGAAGSLAAGAGSLIGRVGAYTAAYAAINLVTGALREGARFAIEFEQGLASLQAISGATETEMSRLSESILTVAQNSNRSVMELTQAATVIAQAGFSSAETGQLLANTATLAAATGSTMAEASDILTSSLGAFNLQVSEASQVNDTLVSVLNESKLAVDTVRLGIQYMGATARQSNVDLGTMTAALGAMADAGVRGSTAATGMRQMFIDLAAPSDELKEHLKDIGLGTADIDIATRGLVPVLELLKSRGFDAFDVLETRAAAAYQVLATNTDEISRLREVSNSTGVALAAEAEATDTVAASWQKFLNTVSEFGQIMGTVLLPVLRFSIDFLTELVSVVNLVTDGIIGLIGHVTGISWAMEMFGDNVDETRTALNEAKTTTDSTRQTMESLGDEIANVTGKFSNMNDTSAEVSAETERLAQRFPNLRAEMGQTVVTAGNLIDALYRLDQQARTTLAENLESQLVSTDAALTAERQKETRLGDQLRSRYVNPSFLGIGGAARDFARQADAAIQDLLRGDARKATALFNRTDLPQAMVTQFRQQVVAFNESRQSRRNLEGSRTNLQRQIPEARAGAVADNVLADRMVATRSSATATATNRAAEGTLAQRRAAALPEIAANKATIARIRSGVTNANAAAARATDPREREIYLARAKRYEASAQRLEIATEAAERVTRETKDETRTREQGERAAATAANRAERTREQIRAQTGPDGNDVKAALVAQGLRATSGNRSWAEQNALFQRNRHIPGAAANPNSAPHVQRRAVDLGIEQDTPANRRLISQTINQMGGTNIRFMPHRGDRGKMVLHVDWSQSTAEAAAEARDDFMQEVRAMQQERTQYYEDEIKVRREEVDLQKSQMEEALRLLDEERDITKIGDRVAVFNREWGEYVAAQTDLTGLIAEKDMLIGDQLTRFTEAASGQLTAERRERLASIMNNITSALDEYLKRQADAAEQQFRSDTAASRRTLAIEQGTLAGLEMSRRGGAEVPNYVRQLQQYRVEDAERALMTAEGEANQRRLETERAALEAVKREKQALGDRTELNRQLWDQINARIITAENRVQDLTIAQEGYNAKVAASAGNQAGGWGQSIDQATEVWMRANQGAASLEDRLKGGLGDALKSVHQGFQGFFQDMMDGSVSVGQAFGNMAKSIIAALGDMAAKAIATQLFSMILTAVGVPTTPAAGAYRGGLIEGVGRDPKRFATGGLVTSGLPTRDSVPALLSKGEFVMQRSAVESMGHRMLMDINNRGAAALNKVRENAAPIVMPAAPPVNTSVYVVMPEEKPQLGPNDILAVVSNDMLRGGATKQLVKQISNGG